jgi:MFS family permease
MVMAVGACCFGVTVGYLTYRSLVRTRKTAVTDIVTVVGAIGGAAVTGLFDPHQGDAFGWYSIGLLAGLAAFFLLFLSLNGRKKTAAVMGAADLGDLDAGAPMSDGPQR